MMYDVSSISIVTALLGGMFLTMYTGRVLGKRRPPRDENETGQVTATQASLLGILGLLLGFTFSVALGRHDARSAAVVAEANAIGTAWLRTDYLMDSAPIKSALLDYTNERVAASTVPATENEKRDSLIASAEAAFSELWKMAAAIAREQPSPATVAFSNSLNDMIDELSARDAAIDRHVPEIVLIMLYATFLLSGWLLGYASGAGRTRITATALVMPVLIVALVFVIIDLDRPRRGAIVVDQTPIVAVLDVIQDSQSAAN